VDQDNDQSATIAMFMSFDVEEKREVREERKEKRKNLTQSEERQ
jgi:hypothetical protein